MEETCLTIRIGYLLKTSNRKFHNGELKFPKYIENTNICPVTTLKQYLHMTSKNRGEIKSLFITQVRPFKPASKDAIARWTRETLSKPVVLQVVQPKRVVILYYSKNRWLEKYEDIWTVL